MGDYSPCQHGRAIGYCDDCNPGWEQRLRKDDAEDVIYQRGYERGFAATSGDALDAARYRWLRQATIANKQIPHETWWDELGDRDNITFDKFIDARMEKQNV